MNSPDSFKRLALALSMFVVSIFVCVPLLYLIFLLPARHDANLMASELENAQTSVQVFADLAEAPLTFQDKLGLDRLVRSAARNPNLRYLAVLGVDGHVWAMSGKKPEKFEPMTSDQSLVVWEAGATVHVAARLRAVNGPGDRIGSIQAGYARQAGTGDSFRRRIQFVGGFAFIMSLAMLALGGALAATGRHSK